MQSATGKIMISLCSDGQRFDAMILKTQTLKYGTLHLNSGLFFLGFSEHGSTDYKQQMRKINRFNNIVIIFIIMNI